ncbi:MAG: type IV-A pilus assembly ATPase PilB, partial [Bdellovibrionales bacterium]|nr:type IV-A pilus assembly ATPase PilB [Bdellovibrionales bacterium]
IISIDQLQAAQREQKQSGAKLTSALVRLGIVSGQQLSQFLADQYGVQAADLNLYEPDEEALKLVSKELCEKHLLIPLSKAGNTIIVAMADPTNIHARDDIAYVTRCKVEVMVAPENDILTAIDKRYRNKVSYEALLTEMEKEVNNQAQAAPQAEIVDAEKGTDDSPIVRFVNLMLEEAVKMRSSDIHIESYEKRFRIRFRIDGVLYEKIQPPPGIAGPLVSRLKIMSKLDISERRRPQDGRLKINIKGKRETDFRVSICPMISGEKIVLRILDKSNLQLDMTQLGLEKEELDVFMDAINQPYGMVLITGPTGSGKTTTIYSALSQLNKSDVNISTAEDPVEFNLDGINQVQMNADVDLNFSSALRSFLRQDPDVIMVGEIRDYETGDIAFKAALTGHLVVSTLHTNDAPQTIGRLLNMGFEPFMVTSAVQIVVAQRLVRKVCKTCVQPFKVEPEILISLGVKPEHVADYQLMKGAGCEACHGIGYKGRIAVYEMLRFNDAVKECILKGSNPLELKRVAIENGMQSLRMAALKKLKIGQTTIEEVESCTARD